MTNQNEEKLISYRLNKVEIAVEELSDTISKYEARLADLLYKLKYLFAIYILGAGSVGAMLSKLLGL